MENIEKENKRLKVLLVIMIVVLLGLGCYHYYVTYINVDRSNDNEAVNVVDDIGNEEQEEAYIGKYFSEDGYNVNGRYLGDPNVYIVLNEDKTYISNRNMCEGYDIEQGKYSVTNENGEFIITLEYRRNDDNHNVQFIYKDGKLNLVNPENQYAAYDCSNTQIFSKKN